MIKEKKITQIIFLSFTSPRKSKWPQKRNKRQLRLEKNKEEFASIFEI